MSKVAAPVGSDAYYQHVRLDIEPLLPAKALRILDVGCGAGVTSNWLRSIFGNATTVGMEGFGGVTEAMKANLDEPYIADLNGTIPDVGSPDLILMLDVLEHLYDAQAVLNHMKSILAPGGTVIISLPNIAHLSVSGRLFLLGQFDYQEAGIMDRTHVKFYTKKTIRQLVESVGLKPVKMLATGMNRKSRLLNKLTLRIFEPWLAKQYLISAQAD